MLPTLLSYAPSIVGLLAIGLVTFVKNARDELYVWFFVLALVMAAWLAALMVGDLTISSGVSLWCLRAAAGIGTLIVPAALYFSVAFPVQLSRVRRLFHLIVLIPAAAFIVLAFTPWLIPGVQLDGASVQPSDLNLLYTLQTLYAVAGLIASFVIILRKWRRVAARERAQIRLVIGGLVVAVVVNVMTGFVLAETQQANNYSNLAGSLSFLVFIGTTAYAIIKHRLFDIRLAIVRSIGFILTVGIMSAVYSLLILGVGAPLLTNGRITLVTNSTQLFLLVPPTIIAALTFHSLQTFIARVTRGVFYQDLYDTRDTLDALSDALLSSNDIDIIMARGLRVLSAALRPSHSLFVVLDDQGKPYRTQLAGRPAVTDQAELLQKAHELKDRVSTKDTQPDGTWPRQFEDEDIVLVLRLGNAKHHVGVLFLGPKQNGRIYSRQDTELLNVSAKNFNIAVENAKKYEQIAAFADTMHKEVLHATTRLRHANSELKTLDAMKDDFISMASHQLRSPATSVHEAIQMLSQDYLAPADRKKIMELAEASSERLVGVITDMLSIARIQAGHFTLEETDVNMTELVDRAILEASGLARQKHIGVQFKSPKQPIHLSADRAKLNEIMSNYLENAIKYSPENSLVTVSLHKDGDAVRFEVADAGIGVPLSERKDLFKKFYRAANARKEQPNGNGIGLFVVKTVAEAHGGDVYYRPLEVGSLFGFRIPVHRI